MAQLEIFLEIYLFDHNLKHLLARFFKIRVCFHFQDFLIEFTSGRTKLPSTFASCSLTSRIQHSQAMPSFYTRNRLLFQSRINSLAINKFNDYIVQEVFLITLALQKIPIAKWRSKKQIGENIHDTDPMKDSQIVIFCIRMYKKLQQLQEAI